MNYNQKKIDAFEQRIDLYFQDASQAQKLINDAMLYSLKAGGKRIRPLLLIEMCLAFGGTYEDAIDFAVGIEMIHTYSLIHDDLPCMDDDDLRRGKPTNHVVYGYDMAVLAGDGLLNKAYEVMLNRVIKSDYSHRAIQAMHEILKASGSNGMILGQVADIKYQSDDMDVETLDFINHHKTGKLIIAAMKSGAILGGAHEDAVNAVEEIAGKMGLLFQVVDDLLDLIGSAEKLGKRTQMDIKNDKRTYPMLLGLDNTQKRIKQLEGEIIKGIRSLDIQSDFLIETVKFLVNRDY
ncbi:polyprenyl synthetase family protein [Fusibacter ferrireducens]|uniref:Polyprenyl synthetase family protein n=1 Tax=Fusibacter ferrireducens TaxID=2785058 RepID=A0ABR9ZT86_9FIRM|nr:farnesyl diphosphate synthase [Fusibacter ferrireducens]MBF4693682.1 polyprenyl synthetase family protein [Fusibacter ferrireducens]